MAEFGDFFTETEASREGYLWKYYDDHGQPKLTYNPDTVAFRREVFGHEYTIISGFERDSE
ncbi:hypothetical protein Htur_5063 (plasmid) [Haloterrigena turkmenica DSM 5511]|uniref:Uncharacterized protein n=1 Tax=Haloterrigena turkmenica (strain ATCC 51198 / DSM 5511 / JCM 9101 / NCIMB 13204 / VKM B-1734 / 4k) TaxID=543526 RepID=D2S3K3_HALTV|nr:hypothetical protein [Haloterrigena turkmenica]ADB63950.1 hypothetical protein Htur_5063 [Haloterrigena turkmenica DSM 5511]